MRNKKMTQRLFTSLLVFLCCVGVAFAQNRTITGTVVDGSDIPIIGANVLVVGTTTGVITNVDGEFTLEVPPQAKIQVSYIGYVTQTVSVGNQTKLKIQLHEDSQTLDELVVVGYSMQRRESLTGSLSTVKDEKLKDVTTPSVENMLNSKIPGVYVQPGTGQPGSTGAMMIRGKATISGNSAPLWVIDGVIVGYNSGELNPADIESLTVLKDAASTAIYGSQGANGVIVVTTKTGRAEKMTVNASVKLGISRLNNGNLEMMDGAELYDYYASFSNADQINFTRWTPELRNSNFDWWDLATQTGFTQDYNISITGGNEKITSYFSLGYYDEEGAVKGYDYSRYNFRYRSSYKPFKWLTVKPSISGAMRDVRDAQYSVGAMYTNLPWDSPYDENGDLVSHYYGGWVNSQNTNYLLDLSYGDYTSYKTYDFMGNFDFDIRFTDWLTFSSVNSYRWIGYYYHSYTDPRSSSGEGVSGRIQEYQQNRVYRYTNQLLRFNKTWGKHSVNALLGYEFNDYQNKVIEAIHVQKAFGEKVLFNDLNFMLPPNGIVGVIGPNGAGKTTLFRLIMGLEQPDGGSFEVGETVKLAYVDQTHKDIAPGKSVYEVISGGNELMRMGNRDINVRAYLSRFNFTGADQEKKCGVLSGGERNRLHLAMALKEEGNVLLLDEPTNDIDVNTLRALEEGLEEFAGCAVVISHDRWFLDRICTHILAFEGDGNVFFYEGSYSEYEADKMKRLGLEEPKRIRYRKLMED